MRVMARGFNHYDALKWLASVTMTLDHLGVWLLPQWRGLRVIGRIAMPVFCFLAGWNGQYRFRWSLLVAALLASATDLFLWQALPGNILWTILLGRMLLAVLDRRVTQEKPWVMLLALLVWLPASVALTEYGSVALLWMLFGRAQRHAPGSAHASIYGLAACFGTVGLSLLYLQFSEAEACLTASMLLALLLGLRQLMPQMPTLRRPAWLATGARHALSYYLVHRALLLAARTLLASPIF